MMYCCSGCCCPVKAVKFKKKGKAERRRWDQLFRFYKHQTCLAGTSLRDHSWNIVGTTTHPPTSLAPSYRPERHGQHIAKTLAETKECLSVPSSGMHSCNAIFFLQQLGYQMCASIRMKRFLFLIKVSTDNTIYYNIASETSLGMHIIHISMQSNVHAQHILFLPLSFHFTALHCTNPVSIFLLNNLFIFKFKE